MLDRTRRLWEKQNRPAGDRRALFGAVAEAIDVTTVLYPGCYVDLGPSFVWPVVTYVDVDRRAKQFFDDSDGTRELLSEEGIERDAEAIRYIDSDYNADLDVAEGSIDLLISLYAGFISEPCGRYLRTGGWLLVNPSHGDAGLASLDARFRLGGVVDFDGDRYVVDNDELETHLIPKRGREVTEDLLRETGRGVAYTRSPFAYLFERVA